MGMKFSVEDLKGVVAVTPTPALEGASDYRARDTVDLAESDRMIRALVSDGVDGILTNGTLGEMATLTLEEWKAFSTVVAEAVADTQPDLPLFIGATGPNTRETIDRITHLDSLGVKGAFLGRPMWSALGPEPLVRYYRDISAAFPDTAIIVYENAEAFKGPIPVPAYAELAKNPRVIGAKYGSLGPKARADFDAVKGRMRLMPIESDWLMAQSLYPETAIACWSSSALCGPLPVLRLRDAINAGDLDAARRITHRMEWSYEPFLARRDFAEFSRYNIPLEKIRFDEAGYVHAGPVRPPYHVVPGPYAEGAKETGRRWAQLVSELGAESIPSNGSRARARASRAAPRSPNGKSASSKKARTARS